MSVAYCTHSSRAEGTKKNLDFVLRRNDVGICIHMCVYIMHIHILCFTFICRYDLQIRFFFLFAYSSKTHKSRQIWLAVVECVDLIASTLRPTSSHAFPTTFVAKAYWGSIILTETSMVFCCIVAHENHTWFRLILIPCAYLNTKASDSYGVYL